MPSRSQHPCTHPGCPRLVRGQRRCPEHTRQAEAVRGTASQRGYDAKWRTLRATWIGGHPFCSACASVGVQSLATQVDHIVAHMGNDALRLDPANLQSLCMSCHSRKTVGQDGGLGRVRVVHGGSPIF